MSRTQQNIMRTIKNTKGRFFGLYTKGGEALNAQYVDDTPSYVTVYDRNASTTRKLATRSLAGVYFQGSSVGRVF